MKRFILVSACSFAVLACLGQPASATEGKSFSWSGFYLGGSGGYAQENGTVKLAWAHAAKAMAAPLNVGSYPATKTAYSLKGPLFGIFLGFNHQFSNNLVLGFDIDRAQSNYAKLFLRDDLVGDEFPLRDSNHKISKPGESEYTIDCRAGARLRLGYSFGHFLPYIAGGVNFLNMKMHDVELDVKSYEVVNIERNQVLTGGSVAAGADIGLTDNLFMRAEYRYNAYAEATKTLHKENDNKLLNRVMTLSGHELRLGFGYKF